MRSKIFITLLLCVAAFFASGQDEQFTNLQVRGRTTLRGFHYLYDTTFFKPDLSNLPFLKSTEPLNWLLTTSTSDAKLTRVSMDRLADSLGVYWIYKSNSPDTTYNKYSGIVAIKGNLELQTTSPTVGQIKQNGETIFHTYQDGGGQNLFIGNRTGNFTLTGNNNIAIGDTSLYSLLTGEYNIAIGKEALKKATTSLSNIAIGWQSAFSVLNGAMDNVSMGEKAMWGNQTGDNNIAIGQYSLGGLGINRGDMNDNVAIGKQALYCNNTGGNNNTAIGSYALNWNNGNGGSTAVGYRAMYYADNRTSGRTTYNTGIGYESLFGSTTAANNTGRYNSGLGYQTLYSMTSGDRNTAMGYSALYSLTVGVGNTAVGDEALYSTTTGNDNVAYGYFALKDNINGIGNVGLGYSALKTNKGNHYNIAIGTSAMAYANDVYAGSVSSYNIAIGNTAMRGSVTPANNTGVENIAIGNESMTRMTTGSYNTVLGNYAGDSLTTGIGNTFLGYHVGSRYETLSNKIAIGNSNADSNNIPFWADCATKKIRLNGDTYIKNGLWLPNPGQIIFGALDANIDYSGTYPNHLNFISPTAPMLFEVAMNQWSFDGISLTPEPSATIGLGTDTTRWTEFYTANITDNGTDIKLKVPASTGDSLLIIDGQIVKKKLSNYPKWADTTQASGVGMATYDDLRTKAAKIGYTVPVMASVITTPAESTTYYFGGMSGGNPTTSAEMRKIFILKSGTITAIQVTLLATTAGSNENWTLYVRHNNTTDYAIATVGVSANIRSWTNTSLSIAVSAGDFIEIKFTTPVWVTDPASLIFGGYAFIQTP